MKPKEKAADLFVKNIELIPDYIKQIDAKHIAKQCALIAVDEIIDNIVDDDKQVLNYWAEVKHEIENL